MWKGGDLSGLAEESGLVMATQDAFNAWSTLSSADGKSISGIQWPSLVTIEFTGKSAEVGSSISWLLLMLTKIKS